METLLDAAENSAMINRINKLSADSKPLWGKLTVSQMLKHSEIGIRIAQGEIKLKRKFIGLLFGKFAKRSLMSDKPFGKNLPTDKTFLKFDDSSFEEAKQSLIDTLKMFQNKGENGITKETHPFFGELTTSEWDKLQYKHLDHHLRQFGV
ncbi:hypothetical protein BH10BAC5_BH10BAC5_07150 [soil metagenome]